MSTKRCAKGLKRDKPTGKCVSVAEFNARKKRSTTLKKMDKMNTKVLALGDKTVAAGKTWKDNLEFKPTGQETSTSIKRHKKFMKAEKDYDALRKRATKLEDDVGDIEDKHNINKNDLY